MLEKWRTILFFEQSALKETRSYETVDNCMHARIWDSESYNCFIASV